MFVLDENNCFYNVYLIQLFKVNRHFSIDCHSRMPKDKLVMPEVGSCMTCEKFLLTNVGLCMVLFVKK